MAEILPIRRKTQSNQSIIQSFLSMKSPNVSIVMCNEKNLYYMYIITSLLSKYGNAWDNRYMYIYFYKK